MAVYDIVVRGGRVVTPSGVQQGGIAIKDGRFAAVGDVDTGDAARTIDAEDRWVLPGVVDSHVHEIIVKSEFRVSRLADAIASAL